MKRVNAEERPQHFQTVELREDLVSGFQFSFVLTSDLTPLWPTQDTRKSETVTAWSVFRKKASTVLSCLRFSGQLEKLPNADCKHPDHRWCQPWMCVHDGKVRDHFTIPFGGSAPYLAANSDITMPMNGIPASTP